MGYFKRLSDLSFKVDSQGNTIFYPWGIIGKGYVLPDKQTEDRIRKFVIRYNAIGVTVFAVIGGLNVWIVNFLFVVPISIFVWLVQCKRFITGLQQSDEKLSFNLKENLKRIFGRDSN